MAGYTRQSTYTDGDVIDAADSNDEFDQLVATFSNATGHKHDGTAAEGPVIGLIGDPGIVTPLNKVVVSDTNNRIGVFVDVSSSSVEQVRFQDGVIVPVTHNDIDLGTTGTRFKNLYLQGTMNVAGTVTLPGNVIVSGTLGANLIPSADDTYDIGSSAAQWKDLYIDGIANIDSLIADTADINGGTIDATVIGGTTTAAGSFTTLAASGNTTVGGTLGVTGAATLSSTLAVTGNTTLTANLTVNGNTTLGNAATDTVTITADVASHILPSADDTYDLGAVGSEWKDIYIDGVAYVDSIAMPTTTVTDILDEDTMVSNSATALATQQSIKAYVDSQVTAQDLDFQGDTGGALSIDLDSEALTIAGGTGIDTSGSLNTLTVAIDSTVATLIGTQTLTNKTLTTPIISSISNTGTLTLPTSTDTLVGRATTDTLTNKTLTSAVLNGTVSGTSIKDEDNMVSDSASHLATQQSIKAYVDAQVTASDLDFQADTGGALSIDLDSEVMTFTGGTGIDTSGSGNVVTFAIDSTVATLTGTQTLTNKTLTSPTVNGGSLSSTVTGVTQAAGTNNTTIATTAFAVTEANNAAVAMAIALG
jgi:hypothetical protein